MTIVEMAIDVSKDGSILSTIPEQEFAPLNFWGVAVSHVVRSLYKPLAEASSFQGMPN